MTLSICQLKHRDQFPEWLNVNGLAGEGVEVGVFEGQYSELIASRWQGRLVGVDPFIHYPDSIYKDGSNRTDLPAIGKATAQKMSAYSNYILFPEESLMAVERFMDGKLDFVYLDGNHGLKHIRNDIEAWWPKVKPGGLLCGHDMYDRENDAHSCGVATAVLEFLYANKLSCHVTPCTSWWVVKP